MEILFSTSNRHKVVEANDAGKEHGVSFRQVNETYPEIRDDSVAAVAEAGVRHVYERLGKPVIVEDSGLFIDALKGFPGPYSSFVFKRIGNEGILRLMGGQADRSARFVSAVGYASGGDVKVFEGVVEGVIATEARGRLGFGYDPVFQPTGHDKTFAEDPERKNKVSHRRKAVEKLCEHLKK